MKYKSGYCPVCGTERRLKIRVLKQTFPVRGEPVTVEAEAAFCTVCRQEVFDRELDFAALERAYAKYRRLKGLPTPEQIVALRERYGLSQQEFAKLLGWSLSTVYRYELGAIPSPAHAEVLKRLAAPDEMAKLLKNTLSNMQERKV